MAFESQFAKLTFGGSLAQGNEIFSCGLSVALAGSTNTPEQNFDIIGEEMEAIGDVIAAFFTQTNTRVPADAKLLWAKLALIGTDGKYVKAPVEIQLDEQGGQGGSYVPQNAVVNTLVSGVWKDPGKYNRFYMPFAFAPTDNDWKLSLQSQTNYAANLATFVDGLNSVFRSAAETQFIRVAVVSNSGTGYDNAVQEVRVGRIIDTQRRRRNQLDEEYITEQVDFL